MCTLNNSLMHLAHYIEGLKYSTLSIYLFFEYFYLLFFLVPAGLPSRGGVTVYV